MLLVHSTSLVFLLRVAPHGRK